MSRLYLAGPIHGCTDQEAYGWRDEATAALSDLFEVVTPMARDYRGREHDTPPDQIVEADLDDIKRCTHLLLNCERPSWGTAQEMVYARQYGKHIVAFGAGVSSPWVRYHADRWCGSLADAVSALRLSPARGRP